MVWYNCEEGVKGKGVERGCVQLIYAGRNP